jgi:hypothetical protein
MRRNFPFKIARLQAAKPGALALLLGYHTRTQVHAFLKEHGVYLRYGPADLECITSTCLRGNSSNVFDRLAQFHTHAVPLVGIVDPHAGCT